MYKAIVFDFDGVIVDSEPIKQGGYSCMFSEFGEAVPEAAVREGLEAFAEGGGNRFEIIREILRRRDGTEPEESSVRRYAERYGSVVEKKVQSLVVPPGVFATLATLAGAYPLYINSRTPSRPLAATIRSLGLSRFFKGVLGGELTKVDNLARIAEDEDAMPAEMLFVGDSRGDEQAAKKYGCVFIGVGGGWGHGVRSVDSIADLRASDIGI